MGARVQSDLATRLGAFDDFGTGHASLSYLLKFPLSRTSIAASS
jgi:EAL domain-containing protein (putative c-di-GMP-specific phosphodiesterase class I)